MTKREQQYRDYCAEHHEPPVRATPGPWVVSLTTKDEYSDRWMHIVAPRAERMICMVAHANTPEGEFTADLIAAAPDMLACLLKIVTSPADSAKLYDEIESAIPVILKAKGELR